MAIYGFEGEALRSANQYRSIIASGIDNERRREREEGERKRLEREEEERKRKEQEEDRRQKEQDEDHRRKEQEEDRRRREQEDGARVGGGSSSNYVVRADSQYSTTVTSRDDDLARTEMRVLNNIISHEAHLAYHYIKNYVEREMSQDAVGKEIVSAGRTAMAVSGFVGGIALTLAATAAESIHAYKMVDAQESAKRDFSAAFDESVSRQVGGRDLRNQAALDDFKHNQQRAAEQLSVTRAALLESYVATKNTAHDSIEVANSEYRKKQDWCDHNERMVAKQLQDNIKRIESDDTIIDKNDALRGAKEAHDSALKSIESQRLDAAQKLNKVVESQRALVDEAAGRYQTNVNLAKTSVANTNDMIEYHQAWADSAHGIAIGSSNVTVAAAEDRAKMIVSATKNAAHYDMSVEKVNVFSGSQAGRFADDFSNKHLTIGKDLAYSFGSAEEIALLKKVDADANALADAKKRGIHLDPTTTKQEREEAKKIIAKYAGDVSSKAEIEKTVKNLSDAVADYQAKIDSIDMQISKTQKQISVVDRRIAETQAIIKQITEDNKALRLGRNADGTKLTKEQRATITARLSGKQEMSFYLNKLTQFQTHRNKLTQRLDRSLDQREKNTNAMFAVMTHAAFLQKHGKTIADMQQASKNKFIAKFETRGSKAAQKQRKRAADAFKHSSMEVKKALSKQLSDGNDLHKEIRSVNVAMRKMDKFGRRYDKAVNVASMGLKFIGKSTNGVIRSIGQNTRLGRKLSGKFQGLANSKFAKGARGFSSITGKGVGMMLKAPGKILMAPMTIRNAPKKAAKAVLRHTGKSAARAAGRTAHATGRLLKAGARVTGKAARYGINSTIGKKAFYQKFQAKRSARLAHRRIQNEQLRKLAAQLTRPFRAVGGAIAGVFNGIKAAIAGMLSSIASACMTALGYVTIACGALVLLMVMVVLLMSATASIAGSIFGWLNNETLSAQEQTYLKNQPNAIVQQVVNYRNAELEIFDLFAQASKDKSLMKVCSAPIYHSLYKGSTFFGLTDDPLKRNNDNVTNSDYKQYKKNVPSSWEYVDAILLNEADGEWKPSHCFQSNVERYDDIKIAYYTMDAVLTDSNGDYVTTTKNGITQYVLKDGAVPSGYEISNANDALILVDALYTQKYNTMQTQELYAYLGVGQYQLTSGSAQSTTKNLFWATHGIIYNCGTDADNIEFHQTDKRTGMIYGECNNCTTIRISYEEKIKHTSIDKDTGKETVYYTYEDHTRDFDVCRGHIKLDVAIVVSLIEDGSIFKDVARVEGYSALPNQPSYGSAYADPSGSVWYNSFSPSADWAEDSDLIELAQVKHDAKYTYLIDPENLDKINTELTHNYSLHSEQKPPKFWTFSQINNENFAVGMYVDGSAYYLEAFACGEQKNVYCYINGKPTLISLRVDANGVPYVTTRAPD